MDAVLGEKGELALNYHLLIVVHGTFTHISSHCVRGSGCLLPLLSKVSKSTQLKKIANATTIERKET